MVNRFDFRVRMTEGYYGNAVYWCEIWMVDDWYKVSPYDHCFQCEAAAIERARSYMATVHLGEIVVLTRKEFCTVV